MAPLPAFVTGADAPSFRSSAPWTGSGAAGVGACTFGFGARKDIGLWFLSGGGDSLQIVDDLRFPNEYERIIQLGGYPVKVDRPGTAPYTAHPSEGLLEHYPMPLINNNSTIAELRACAERLPELLGAHSPY